MKSARDRLRELGLKPPPADGPAILVFDNETTPLLGWAWHRYRPYIDEIERYSHLLCFSWMWFGDKRTMFAAQWHDPAWRPWGRDDSWLAVRQHALFDASDVVVAFNGERFDIRKSNVAFRSNGFGPPSPYQTVDPMREGKRYFAEDSHRLKHLSIRYHEGEKVPHPGGMDMWFGCMSGDVKMQRLMERYNRQDTLLCRDEYQDVRAWMAPGKKAHPNLGHWNTQAKLEGRPVCPACGFEGLQKRGFHRTHVSVYQTWWCNPETGGCGKYSRTRKREEQHLSGGVEAC